MDILTNKAATKQKARNDGIYQEPQRKICTAVSVSSRSDRRLCVSVLPPYITCFLFICFTALRGEEERKTDWLKHTAEFQPSLWMWLCVGGEQVRQSNNNKKHKKLNKTKLLTIISLFSFFFCHNCERNYFKKQSESLSTHYLLQQQYATSFLTFLFYTSDLLCSSFVSQNHNAAV